MAADRAQHVAEVIRPALEGGRHVVCDRYLGSSIAYQGYGRGLDPSRVAALSEWATEGLVPDLTVLLDVPEDGRRGAPDVHTRPVRGRRARVPPSRARWLPGARGRPSVGGGRRHAQRGRGCSCGAGRSPRPSGSVTTAVDVDLFREVIGQDRAVAQLRAAVADPVHAYLFVGPSGSGKRAAAHAFAAALLAPAGR